MPIFDSYSLSGTAIIPDTNTLSVNYRPGQNKRLVASKSEAIFSFGDFTIERDYTLNYLSGDSNNLQFSTFDSLESLNAVNFTNNKTNTFVQHNELKLPKKNPKSHAYFSSFYTSVAASINKIIENYPYAIYSYNNGDINIYDYTENFNNITHEKSSSFKIPISGLINQSNININSANTSDNFSLPYDYQKFCIQLSGGTEIFTIKNYALSGTYLYFEVVGFLQGGNSITTYTDALYIRPTKERMYDFNKTITSLETQLINEGVFLVPAISTPEDDSFEQVFKWPKSIDGWAPDSYGSDFEIYKENILKAAEKVDDEKTDIFIKTVIPENFLELDSDGQIYRTIVQTYAYEFDKLKNYIDAIAYAHSVEYNDEESVPNKFMLKLSRLLGWKLSDAFNELDLFEYLTAELGGDSNSYSHFNLEIWRRILVNLVWLYKKKGTRDAIMFIFKLLGAPDCLINFNEFVYDVNRNVPNHLANEPHSGDPFPKIDVDGYINYNNSAYIFQEGGDGRGNGDNYITQWLPEFSPIRRIDNEKVQTGETITGTRWIVNTKEIEMSFAGWQAIECDVFQYYQQNCTCWMWGSSCPPFSCLTTPFDYLTWNTCADVAPANIADMTLNQYIDYIYTNNIDPTTRKTNNQAHFNWGYPELQNIYLAYYYATCPKSNALTMCKLEGYLQLLEAQLGDYILQLVPATTIFEDGVTTSYKNPIFNRQRFVYREGVDRGSMFRKSFPEEIKPKIISPKVSGYLNEKTKVNISQIKINVESKAPYSCEISPMNLNVFMNNTLKLNTNAFKVKMVIDTRVRTVIGAVSIKNSFVSESEEQLVNERVVNY